MHYPVKLVINAGQGSEFGDGAHSTGPGLLNAAVPVADPFSEHIKAGEYFVCKAHCAGLMLDSLNDTTP